MKDSGSLKRADLTVDCIGLYCPIPILNTRQAMDKLAVGEILEVLADDPAAEDDLKAWAKRAGQKIILIENNDAVVRFLIQKEK
jgi:TusA-related sulfurtransferase